MSAHTPAPWTASKWTTHAATTVTVDDESFFTGKRVIAECESEEDARLVAAALDLLDALVIAREFISTDRMSLADSHMREDGTMEDDATQALADYDKALLQIDAAIQKANRGTA